MPKLALYAVAALIVAFEVGVLLTAVHPDVAEEYADYYISRSSDCWATAASGSIPLNVTLGLVGGPNPWPPVARHVLVCGWIGPLVVGTWSHGPTSRLRLRLDPVPWADVLLHLELKPLVVAEHPMQRAEFLANGQPIGRLEFTETSDAHQAIRLSARLIAASNDGLVDIEIHLPDAISPKALGVATDNRRLAIRLLSMRLETAPIATQ
jgi:hypothetical protein